MKNGIAATEALELIKEIHKRPLGFRLSCSTNLPTDWGTGIKCMRFHGYYVMVSETAGY